jgi:rubredoxin
MTYAYYHQIKGGTTPKTAPTYIEDEKKEEEKMEGLPKYKCEVCGYIYDPEKGDPDGDIPPGTPFEKLPDDWICPVCGAAKSDFKKVD